jgi:hypothetical protein
MFVLALSSVHSRPYTSCNVKPCLSPFNSSFYLSHQLMLSFLWLVWWRWIRNFEHSLCDGIFNIIDVSKRVCCIEVKGGKASSLCCVQSNLVASYTISEPMKRTKVLKWWHVFFFWALPFNFRIFPHVALTQYGIKWTYSHIQISILNIDGPSNKVSNSVRRHIDNRNLLLVCVLLLSHSFLFPVSVFSCQCIYAGITV